MDLSAYTQTFSDEFTTFDWAGPSGTEGTWKTSFYFGGRSLSGNGEQQYYADDGTAVSDLPGYVAPHSVVADPRQPGDGLLRITASESPDPSLTDGLPHVSGLITTEESFVQQYGYFEITAKVPDGQGIWPGFWMLPADGSFPPELDVLEYLGATNANGEGGDTEFWYYLNSADAAAKHGGWYDTGVDLSADFHRYGVLWTPEYVAYYFDGEEIPGSRTPTPDDLHQPMYMIANLAAGASWPGAVDPALFDVSDPSQLPHLDIDSIKAWALPATPPDPVDPMPGDDRVIDTAGDNEMVGGGGSDVFAFLARRPGDDVILGFTPASRDGAEHDVIEFGPRVVAGADDARRLLARAEDVGDGVAINLGAGSTLTLLGVQKSELSAADFLFA